jgi:glycosyltransferase involved in cell wall biosynthesis
LNSILYIQNNTDLKFELNIIGGNYSRIKLYKKFCKKLNINNVNFIGNVSHDKIPILLNNSSVFVLTSSHESFGVVLIEALSCGIPIISTNSGGPSDIVNSSNGFLVPINDHEALAMALFNISNELEKYNSQLLRDFAIKNFSFPVVSEKYYNLYFQILKNGKN